LFSTSTICGKSELLEMRKILFNECRIFINVDPSLEFLGKRLLNNTIQKLKYRSPGSPYMCGFSKQHRGVDDFIKSVYEWIGDDQYKLMMSDVSKWDSRESWLLFLVCMYLGYISWPREQRGEDNYARLFFYYDNICRGYVVTKDGYVYKKSTGNDSGSPSTTHDNNIGARVIEFYKLIDKVPIKLDVITLEHIVYRWKSTGHVVQEDFDELLSFYFKNLRVISEIYTWIDRRTYFAQYSDDMNKIVKYPLTEITWQEQYEAYKAFGCDLDMKRCVDTNNLMDFSFLGFRIKEINLVEKMFVPVSNLIKAKHSLFYTPKGQKREIVFQIVVSLMIETFFDMDEWGCGGYEFFLPIAEIYYPYRNRTKVLIDVEAPVRDLLLDIPTRERVLHLYTQHEV